MILAMISGYFRIAEHNSSLSREILAGLTTFLTMAYILVVQPEVLSRDFSGAPTGLAPGAVLLATCLASAFASGMMGVFARLPVALAPGMGQNFFFVSVVMALAVEGGPGEPWQVALAIVFVSGVLFLLITLLGLRAFVLDALQPGLRHAISVGIGLLIAFIGLRNANVVVDAPSLVTLNTDGLLSSDSAVFWSGLATMIALTVRRVPGAVLAGIVVSAAVAQVAGQLQIDRVTGWPEDSTSAVLQFDFRGVFSGFGLSCVAVFLFMDLFDTTGTLIGVAQHAGLMRDGELPGMRQAMLSDAAGTVAGACLGTSTVTSFIESAAGVEQGGRTGLTAVVVAVLFLAATLFSPLIVALGAYPPVTAPALVIVGIMMFRSVQWIDWADETEAIPAFLTILGIPLFFSIADGIALGLLTWPLLKVLRGRAADVPTASYVLAALVAACFLSVRVTVG